MRRRRLFVSACYGQGPSQKRVRPALMGRAFRVLATAHLTVHVSGGRKKLSRWAPAGPGAAAGGRQAKASASKRKAKD